MWYPQGEFASQQGKKDIVKGRTSLIRQERVLNAVASITDKPDGGKRESHEIKGEPNNLVGRRILANHGD